MLLGSHSVCSCVLSVWSSLPEEADSLFVPAEKSFLGCHIISLFLCFFRSGLFVSGHLRYFGREAQGMHAPFQNCAVKTISILGFGLSPFLMTVDNAGLVLVPSEASLHKSSLQSVSHCKWFSSEVCVHGHYLQAKQNKTTFPSPHEPEQNQTRFGLILVPGRQI